MFEALAGAIGEISADAGASLAGPRWAGTDRLHWHRGSGRHEELAEATGNTVHALAGCGWLWRPLMMTGLRAG